MIFSSHLLNLGLQAKNLIDEGCNCDLCTGKLFPTSFNFWQIWIIHTRQKTPCEALVNDGMTQQNVLHSVLVLHIKYVES